MIADGDAIAALTAAYVGTSQRAAAGVSSFSSAEAAAAIEPHVVEYARAVGWRTPVRFGLEHLEYPRAGAFPRRLHEHAGRIRVRRGEAEIVLNGEVRDSPSFPLLVGRLAVFIWLVGAALEIDPALDADIPCFPGDACFWNAVSFSGNHPDMLLVPDPDFYATGGYARFRDAVGAQPAWQSRRRAVLWRGSTTGIKRYWPPSDATDVRWNGRLELCARALRPDVAELCDMGFVNLAQIPDDALREQLTAALAPLRRDLVPPTHGARYMGVVDIDGNSTTWSGGLYCSLLSGACVFKVASDHGFAQWYYDRLAPWTHYVPVANDLGDFAERVRLLETDEPLVRRIGTTGRVFATAMTFATEMRRSAEALVAWCRALRRGVPA